MLCGQRNNFIELTSHQFFVVLDAGSLTPVFPQPPGAEVTGVDQTDVWLSYLLSVFLKATCNSQQSVFVSFYTGVENLIFPVATLRMYAVIAKWAAALGARLQTAWGIGESELLQLLW